MRAAILSALAVLSLCACSNHPQPESASDPQPAREIRAAYLRAYNNGDADAVAALYSDDATLVTNGGTLQGRSGIRNWIRQALDQGSRLEAIDTAQEKRSGKLAFSMGRSRRVAGGQLHLGQYLIVIEQIGAEWKIVQHFAVNVP